MLSRKLGRLLGLALMLVALVAGAAGAVSSDPFSSSGDEKTLEYEWN